MASITPYRSGWRAFLHVDGHRETKTFRTKREALSWAAHREEELSGSKDPTFAQTFEEWLALKLPELDSEANQRTVENSMRQHVLPVLGGLRLSQISRVLLVKLVQEIARSGRVETAHRLGQRIRQVFDLGVDQGKIQHHPAANLARVLPNRKKERMPAVSPTELPALLHAINTYDDPVTRAGLWLLAHTFVRTSELIGATWDEIRDPETWVIPAERMKRRLPHVVPLSPQVRAILEDLRLMDTGTNAYFLASAINPLHGLSSNTLLFALYRLGYRGRMTGHGFRSVASTILNESGLWRPDVIERQLAHGETDDVRSAYNRAEFLPERRQMMTWWSAHLEALAASTSS